MWQRQHALLPESFLNEGGKVKHCYYEWHTCAQEAGCHWCAAANQRPVITCLGQWAAGWVSVSGVGYLLAEMRGHGARPRRNIGQWLATLRQGNTGTQIATLIRNFGSFNCKSTWPDRGQTLIHPPHFHQHRQVLRLQEHTPPLDHCLPMPRDYHCKSNQQTFGDSLTETQEKEIQWARCLRKCFLKDHEENQRRIFPLTQPPLSTQLTTSLWSQYQDCQPRQVLQRDERLLRLLWSVLQQRHLLSQFLLTRVRPRLASTASSRTSWLSMTSESSRRRSGPRWSPGEAKKLAESVKIFGPCVSSLSLKTHC